MLRCHRIVDPSVHSRHLPESARHLQFLPCQYLSGYDYPDSLQGAILMLELETVHHRRYPSSSQIKSQITLTSLAQSRLGRVVRCRGREGVGRKAQMGSCRYCVCLKCTCHFFGSLVCFLFSWRGGLHTASLFTRHRNQRH